MKQETKKFIRKGLEYNYNRGVVEGALAATAVIFSLLIVISLK